MSNLYMVHTASGRAPDPDAARRLDPLDADAAAWLRATCGIDTRALYHASTERPTPATRLVVCRPRHGHYEATMLRPTRRERVRDWWYAHRWEVGRFLLLTGSFLLAFLALNLILDGVNALLDAGGW